MNKIRRISVHVDEPDPGRFYWVLMEEGGDASQWAELQSADEGYDMWLDALQAGMRALERLASDERIGPRIAGDDEDSSPVGETQFLS
ncbi:hypothetical protein M2282_005201 [Variovorax boronicumulans]|uniref:hypothetical protein n=1 Tax=Variovorax boronicumulans TaxID=436515 RepID=UPI0024753A57|nr:hypothetical protein [Variovorax boronicumulans]MDH6170031.1 hypothetical protein [Variovorax boronicumulans]